MKDLTNVLAAVKKERLRIKDKFDSLSQSEKYSWLKDEIDTLYSSGFYTGKDIETLIHVSAVAIGIVQHLSDRDQSFVVVQIKESIFDYKSREMTVEFEEYNKQTTYPIFDRADFGLGTVHYLALIKFSVDGPDAVGLQGEELKESAIEVYKRIKTNYLLAREDDPDVLIETASLDWVQRHESRWEADSDLGIYELKQEGDDWFGFIHLRKTSQSEMQMEKLYKAVTPVGTLEEMKGICLDHYRDRLKDKYER